jgi:hypothetical protein
MTSEHEAVERALDLVSGADQRGASLRIVGGVAIAYLCGESREAGADLDFVAGPRDRGAIEAVLAERGFAADREFNHLHGHRRLYFQAPDGLPIDVFIGRMDMCHMLDFRDRLDLFSPTVPPVDLVLSKLQIVEFTDKDHRDTGALLEQLELAERPEMIDTRRIQEVTCADWGWHQTVSQNLERFRSRGDVVGERARALLDLMSSWPKSRRWTIRARVGTRKRWYRLPEEVAHGSAVGGG